MNHVYQHWDRLKTCIVGQSYSPEFYSFIKDSKVRTVFEQIAQETEEDYQALINLLKTFNVDVLRPTVSDDYNDYLFNGKIATPPMTPCDYSVMVGDTFYHNWWSEVDTYNRIKDASWPTVTTHREFLLLPQAIQDEVRAGIDHHLPYTAYRHIIERLEDTGTRVVSDLRERELGLGINRAMLSRIGRDLYFATESTDAPKEQIDKFFREQFPEYRCHLVKTEGHLDGTFCPVVPGLIISLAGVPTYANTFPDWEVVTLPNQSWNLVKPFMNLKNKNKGKWWVPGQELNDEFTDYVEQWMGHWVGYVEETVFDVNMLVIDEKNVVCSNYNKEVFGAFNRYGVTAHVINFRHRFFWDGGWHCNTSDIHREGTLTDYFPGRTNE